MELKNPSHILGKEYDYLGLPDDPTTNALAITWDTEQDTLQPIFNYHLSKKIKGVKKSWELVGLTSEEAEDIVKDIVVTRALLSQITPQSFDLSGIFLGPLKTSLKILLSRAFDITSVQEKDLDLATRDVPLVSDVKILIKEITNLKISPWQRFWILRITISPP